MGASDESDERTVFSSYGPGLDVLAPGVDIWTTFMTYPSLAGASYPGYLSDAGTSFATPFVTGTVGLLAGLRRDLDAGDYQSIIRLSADDVGTPGPDAETGWGRLNAQAALEPRWRRRRALAWRGRGDGAAGGRRRHPRYGERRPCGRRKFPRSSSGRAF
jgi:subtilisin family serine protease